MTTLWYASIFNTYRKWTYCHGLFDSKQKALKYISEDYFIRTYTIDEIEEGSDKFTEWSLLFKKVSQGNPTENDVRRMLEILYCWDGDETILILEENKLNPIPRHSK